MATVWKHQLSLASLVAVSLVVGWRPLRDTLSLSMHNEEYTYILLIIPVVFALLWQEWESLKGKFARDVRAGLPLIASAVAIAALPLVRLGSFTSDINLTMWMTALVLMWVGSFVLSLGRKAAISSMFPLLFLFGLAPLPEVAVNWAVAVLQQTSAGVAHLLFIAFGVPVIQTGVLLEIPGLALVVAPECSSIRSSSMLILVTAVVAHVMLRATWRKALVISLAIPLSVAKNGLRIFTIAILGIRVDRGYLTGRLHHQGGIVFFLIALAAIAAAVWVSRRAESRSLSSKSA